MNREENEETLAFYEAAIRELETSVSLCTLCAVEPDYVHSGTESRVLSLSLFDVSDTSDDIAKSNVTQESTETNDYLATRIFLDRGEESNDDDATSSSFSFADFLKKTTKQVCENLSKPHWDDASWDERDEKRETQCTRCETALPTELHSNETVLPTELHLEPTVLPIGLSSEKTVGTRESTRNFVEILANTNHSRDDEEKSVIEVSQDASAFLEERTAQRTPPRSFASEIRDDAIPRKRMKVSLQARSIVDTPDLLEFSVRFMNVGNERSRTKQTKIFDECFRVSSKICSVDNDSTKNFARPFLDEEIRESSNKVAEEAATIQSSESRKTRGDTDRNCTRSVTEEKLRDEEQKAGKASPIKFPRVCERSNEVTEKMASAQSSEGPQKRNNARRNCTQSVREILIEEDKKAGNENHPKQFHSKCEKHTIESLDPKDQDGNIANEEIPRKKLKLSEFPAVGFSFGPLKENLLPGMENFPKTSANNEEIRPNSRLNVGKKSPPSATQFSPEVERKTVPSEDICPIPVYEAMVEDIPREKPKIVADEILAPAMQIPLKPRYGYCPIKEDDTKKIDSLRDQTFRKNEDTSCDRELANFTAETPALELPMMTIIEIPTREAIYRTAESNDDRASIEDYSMTKTEEEIDDSPEGNVKNPRENEEICSEGTTIFSIEIPIASELKKIPDIEISPKEAICSIAEDHDNRESARDVSSTKNAENVDEHLGKNKKNSQVSDPFNSLDSQHRVALEDPEEDDYCREQGLLENEEMTCEEDAIVSIEIPIASELKTVSSIEISTKEATYLTAEGNDERESMKHCTSTKNTEEIEELRKENKKNAQASDLFNPPDSQHPVESNDSEKNHAFREQTPRENEEMTCEDAASLSIEIPIASELKKVSDIEISATEDVHPIAEGNDKRESIEDNSSTRNAEEDVEFPGKNGSISYALSLFVELRDGRHFNDMQKNNFVDKLTLREIEDVRNEEVALDSIQIPADAESKELTDMEIAMNETIRRISEDHDRQGLMDDPASTKNIRETDELPGRNETNCESRCSEKLGWSEINEGPEEENIAEENEDERNEEVSAADVPCTERALRKKTYPIVVPRIEDIQKSWKAVKKEFLVPRDKRRPRYRPLTPRKSSTPDSKIIREKAAKRRELLTSAIYRLRELSSYTTELRNIFRNDNGTARSKNCSVVPTKVLVSTGTQTDDYGAQPVEPKPVSKFIYNPYHGLRDPKNEAAQNGTFQCAVKTEASDGGRQNGPSPPPVTVTGTIVDQSNQRATEPAPEEFNSSNAQIDPMNFPNGPAIEADVHTYNPLRPTRVLRRFKRLERSKKSTLALREPFFPNKNLP